ncbi:baseplate protein [Escherichia coli]
MSNYSRLDDRIVDDAIIRSYLYRDILNRIAENDSELITRCVLTDEEYRPDLLASRVYGASEGHILRWLVSLVVGNESEDLPLPVGEDIVLPPLTWVRERIRHWSTTAELE